MESCTGCDYGCEACDLAGEIESRAEELLEAQREHDPDYDRDDRYDAAFGDYGLSGGGL
jgi:hypothetical protein